MIIVELLLRWIQRPLILRLDQTSDASIQFPNLGITSTHNLRIPDINVIAKPFTLQMNLFANYYESTIIKHVLIIGLFFRWVG